MNVFVLVCSFNDLAIVMQVTIHLQSQSNLLLWTVRRQFNRARKFGRRGFSVIGLEVGNPRALNMVMLGSLSVFLELETEAWTDNIRHRLPPQFVESSIEAFLRGAEETRAMIQAKETVK